MKLAMQIVYWPGQSTVACDDHAEKLKSLARFMGFKICTVPANGDHCANCENEEKLKH